MQTPGSINPSRRKLDGERHSMAQLPSMQQNDLEMEMVAQE